MNMLSRSAFLSLLVGVVSAFQALADPILPYQQPIAAQLNNDLNAHTGDLKTLSKALDAYHKISKSLNGDVTILKNLNSLLDNTAGYAPLLSDAATSYLADFQGRRDAIREQLRPAPRSATKDSANRALAQLDNALSNAVLHTITSKRISDLQSAAQRLASASNTVQRALRQPLRLSSLGARIGVLKFKSNQGSVAGDTSFVTGAGTTIGDFAPAAGTFSVLAIDNGSFTRGIQIYAQGITTNFPATYPLAAGENSAFYDVTDVASQRPYQFQASSTLTNSLVTNAWLTIDFIGTNYILGRFAFRGTNTTPTSLSDSNLATVTVSQGDFQLNYFH